MRPECGHPVPVRNSAGVFCPYCVEAGCVGVLPDMPDAEIQHGVAWLARHYVLVRWCSDRDDVEADENVLVTTWPEAYVCSDRDWFPQWTSDVTEALVFPSEEEAQKVMLYAEHDGAEVEIMAAADFMELVVEE